MAARPENQHHASKQAKGGKKGGKKGGECVLAMHPACLAC